MTWFDDGCEAPCCDRRAGDAVLITAAGGVIQAALIAMLASSEAFAARLLNGSGQANELYALQLRSLAADISAMKAGKPAPREVDRSIRVDRTVVERAPGAPVVT